MADARPLLEWPLPGSPRTWQWRIRWGSWRRQRQRSHGVDAQSGPSIGCAVSHHDPGTLVRRRPGAYDRIAGPASRRGWQWPSGCYSLSWRLSKLHRPAGEPLFRALGREESVIVRGLAHLRSHQRRSRRPSELSKPDEFSRRTLGIPAAVGRLSWTSGCWPKWDPTIIGASSAALLRRQNLRPKRACCRERALFRSEIRGTFQATQGTVIPSTIV